MEKYKLTATLVPYILKAFREGYDADTIECSFRDAVIIAKAQYDKEKAEAKRETEKNDKEGIKKLLLAGMKAYHSIDDDPIANFLTDEYLDKFLTDDVIDFTSKVITKIVDNNQIAFDEANKFQKKEKKNDSSATCSPNSITDCDSDSSVIREWLKHQEW